LRGSYTEFIDDPLLIHSGIRHGSCNQVDNAELQQRVTALGFSAWSKIIQQEFATQQTEPPSEQAEPKETDTAEYTMIVNWEQFDCWLDKLKQSVLGLLIMASISATPGLGAIVQEHPGIHAQEEYKLLHPQ
jgi:hypothetical protein